MPTVPPTWYAPDPFDDEPDGFAAFINSPPPQGPNIDPLGLPVVDGGDLPPLTWDSLSPPDLGSATAAGIAGIAGGPLPPFVTEGEPTFTAATAPSGPPDVTPTTRPPFAPVGYAPPAPRDPVAFDKPGDYPEPRATIEPVQTAAADEDLAALGASEAFVGEDKLPAQLAGDDAAAKANEDEIARLANDPYARERMRIEQEQARDTAKLRSQMEADQVAIKGMEEAARIRDEAAAKSRADRAQIEQEATAMADGSPFEQWWSSRSTGQKIAGYITAIVGGLMMGKTGGRNSGLDGLIKAADDDAANKWKSLQARRELNGEAMADAEADYRAQTALKVASREQAFRQAEAEAALFAPEGTARLALADMIAKGRAENAAALDKWQADAQKQMVDAYQADSQRMQAEAQMLNAKSLAFQRGMRVDGMPARDTGSGTGKPTAGWGPKDVHDSTEWAKRFGLTDKMVKALPAGDMTGKGFDEWFDKQKAIGNITAEQEREANVRQGRILEKQKFVSEREINDEGDPLYVYGDDGKPLIDNETGDPVRITANTPEEGKAMRAKVRNTKAVIRLLYEAKAIRNGLTAGEVKMPWSDARKRLEVIQKAIGPLVKEGTEGMSSDADMANLVGGVGAKNLTAFLSQTATIDQGIEIAHNLLNGSLHTYHYNGPPIIVKDPYGGAPPKRNDDLARLNKRAPQPGFFSRDTWDPTRAFKDHDGMSDENRAGLAGVVAGIERGDDNAEELTAGLVDAALYGRNLDEALSASNEVIQASAAEFWRLKNAGNPNAVAAWDNLDRAQRAAIIASLPAKESEAVLKQTLAPPKPIPLPKMIRKATEAKK